MRILIFGAGVIGITYGWQLALAGNDVTLYVRPERKEAMQRDGVQIECLDTRGMKPKTTRTRFCPCVVDSLHPSDGYDLILVAVNSNQISAALPALKQGAGEMDIAFLSNNWSGVEEISRSLDAKRYFFAYPFKAGGGRDEQGIQTVIFGTPFTDTVLGELDGSVSNRVLCFQRELRRAGMNPRIHRDIRGYLMAHFVWAAANVAAYMKAGSYDRFSTNSQNLAEMYRAMREGFEVCRARGVDPARLSPTNFYYLPDWLLVPFTRALYGRPEMRKMFEGHVLHSPGEMVDMYHAVLQTARNLGVSVPVYADMEPFIEKFKHSGQNS